MISGIDGHHSHHLGSAGDRADCTLIASSIYLKCLQEAHRGFVWPKETKSDDENSRIQTEGAVFDQITGILLVVALGLCVAAFPFVMWILFADNGPRFRPMRQTARWRESSSSDFFWMERNSEKSPAGRRGLSEATSMNGGGSPKSS
jgi:hypothetical protein